MRSMQKSQALRSRLIGVWMVGLLCAPTWSQAKQRPKDSKASRSFVEQVFLGEGKRFAFINIGSKQGRLWGGKVAPGKTAIRLDLKTGALVRIGKPQRSWWVAPEPIARAYWIFSECGWPLLGLANPGGPRPAEPELFYDGRSGEPLRGDPEALLDQAWTARKWPEGFELEPAPRWCFPAGTGFWMQTSEGPGLHWDPDSGFLLSQAQAKSYRLKQRYSRVLVLPKGWLAQTHGGHWERLDPCTGISKRLDCLPHGANPSAVLSDGSLVHVRRGKALRVWPESGEIERIKLIGFEGLRGALSQLLAPPRLYSSTNKNVFWLRIRGRYQTTGVAVFDPEQNSLKLIESEARTKWGGLDMLGGGEGFGLVLSGPGRLLWLDAQAETMVPLLDLASTNL